jgi:hypothetical protein
METDGAAACEDCDPAMKKPEVLDASDNQEDT